MENKKENKSVKKVNNSKTNSKNNKVVDIKNEREELLNDSLSKSKKALESIDKKIEKISMDNFNDNEVKDILKMIDKEIEKSAERMATFDEHKNDSELKNEADLYQKFNDLNKKLFEKISLAKPFESFFYSDDNDKETMVKEFFKKINDSIHWLDLDKINFNSDYKSALSDKNNIITDSLISVLESNLNIDFSAHQKNSLKQEFASIAQSMDMDNVDEIIDECNKIKTVSNIKLISRPSYKNFISKNELKKNDATKKLSTIRVDFLNYITLNKKEKLKTVTENLEVQLKSIKEILEEEREEYSKKMKVLFLLILASGLLTAAAPAAGALGVIAIGSATAYMQTKVIINDNKIKKIDEELKEIKNGTSEIVNQTFEKLEETSNELLNNEEYSEIAKLYIKKKKESLKAQALKEKVEEQMRVTIIDNLDKMTSSKKEKIIEKVKDKYNVNVKQEENVKDEDLNFDVELGL